MSCFSTKICLYITNLFIHERHSKLRYEKEGGGGGSESKAHLLQVDHLNRVSLHVSGQVARIVRVALLLLLLLLISGCWRRNSPVVCVHRKVIAIVEIVQVVVIVRGRVAAHLCVKARLLMMLMMMLMEMMRRLLRWLMQKVRIVVVVCGSVGRAGRVVDSESAGELTRRARTQTRRAVLDGVGVRLVAKVNRRGRLRAVHVLRHGLRRYGFG